MEKGRIICGNIISANRADHEEKFYVRYARSVETYRGYLLSPWPCPACEPSSSIFPNLNDSPNRTVRAR